jgi:CRISPR/Cas system-associated exonuclease Cas4 (RecB family)
MDTSIQLEKKKMDLEFGGLHKMTDERKGKPSASGFSRLSLCPGSWNLESTLPEQEPNQYMQLGTDVHAVLADQKPFEELTEEGQDIATRILSDYSDMIRQLDLGTITHSVIEERFWYDDLFSGAIDRIDFFGDDVAVVTDYKTGRNSQGKASENQQLKAYGVLVKKAYPKLKTILVAIIQPLAGGTTIAEYNDLELEASEVEILGIVQASLAPDAPRNPSPDACKWCRAKKICPDAYGSAVAATKTIEVVTGVAVANLSNEELASLDAKAEVVEDFIDQIRKELKQRLLNGAQIAGYSLGKGRISRNVSDTASAIATLSDIMPPDVLSVATKISLTSLEKAYAKARGIPLKDAKSNIEEALGWNIETSEGEPTLRRDR